MHRPQELPFNVKASLLEPLDYGTLIYSETECPEKQIISSLKITGCESVLVAYREMMCWMDAIVLPNFIDFPNEAHFVLIKEGANYHLLIGLVDGGFASVMENHGSSDCIQIRAHSDSDQVKKKRVKSLYYAQDSSPYNLIENAYRELCQGHITARPRSEKTAPNFASLFGWCTFNAFYCDVNAEKLQKGVHTFQKKGIQPGFVLIDDGWADQGENEYGHKLLFRFNADSKKFPKGLKACVNELKTNGVSQVLAWTAFGGYWHGTDHRNFPQLTFHQDQGTAADHLQFQMSTSQVESNSDATVGPNFVPQDILETPITLPEDWKAWYQTFARYLRSCDIDGMKIDAIAWIELFAQKRGGRAQAMRDLVRAIEQTSEQYFEGEMLYCSSCSNDFFLQAEQAGVTRTSTDYFPDIPESHGAHVVKNSIISFFTGEIIFPDWDMFQSHEMAAEFHAFARAISGGPIYVADIPEKSNPAILSKLAFADGTTPICTSYARPVIESLFQDCQREGLLTLFNTTPAGGVVLASMHCAWHGEPDAPQNSAHLKMDKVPAFENNTNYVRYCSTSGQLYPPVPAAEIDLKVSLSIYDRELNHFALIQQGVAVIGLVNLYNPGGAIDKIEVIGSTISVSLRGGGSLLIYTEKVPTDCAFNDSSIHFTHNTASSSVNIEVPHKGIVQLHFDT